MMGLNKLGRTAHANMLCANMLRGGAAAGAAGVGVLASTTPAFATDPPDTSGWDVESSGGTDGLTTGGAAAGGGGGDSLGAKILDGIVSVFNEIKIFVVALLILCAVVYMIISVFSSKPEIWRGKIVYVAIILVVLLCLGTILGFITNTVGTGDYVYLQDMPVNG